MKAKQSKNRYILYKHIFPNGKVYIGITCKSVGTRWRKDGSGYSQQKLIWNAIQKYGWDNIKHEILFTNLTKEEACLKEVEYIAKYNSNDIKGGYNQSLGGECSAIGYRMTEEAKNKIREANKGEKCYWYGKHLSAETRRKISYAHKGRTAWNKGSSVSDETKKRILKSSPNKRKVVCVQNNRIYESVGEASRQLNLCKSSVARCCNGQNKTAGGLNFKYADQ